MKGEKIRKHKFDFLLEIFDIYGLKHYFPSISREMVDYYHRNLKKMFFIFIKLLNHSIINIRSLENNIINIHENLQNDFKFTYELELPKIDFKNYFTQKFQGQQFFHRLLFKLFIVKTFKFKPVFAYYNISNFIGFIISLIF